VIYRSHHKRLRVRRLAVAVVVVGVSHAHAQTAPEIPQVDADGTVHVPATVVPFSALASPEARKAFVEWHDWTTKWAKQGLANSDLANVPKIRQRSTELLAPLLAKALAAFPVDIESWIVDGVYSDVLTPKGGISPGNRDRVLIDVRSIASITDDRIFGKLEGAPVSAMGHIKVVAIGNRDSFDYTFPAASQDVATVYRALLKQYRPENIGLMGSSSGGLLVASAIAWFQREKLPRPGAIAMLSSGATSWMEGDSTYMAAELDGLAPLPQTPHRMFQDAPYFRDVDPKTPLLAPGWSLESLRRFPPTLLISGTRDTAMSATVHTHTLLINQDVDAELYLWEGMNHDFFYDVGIPESVEAYKVIVKFFDRHLGKHPR
jgi:pimeloyl-ACP methyl ester carboxylesterase